MKKDARVDAYIAKAPAFAQPILKTLRSAIHEGAPDVSETMRWSMPSFDVAGKPFCHVAAFKAHCRFVFWTGVQTENHDLERFGSITTAADLPSKKDLVAVVTKAAKARIEQASTEPKTKSTKTPAPNWSAIAVGAHETRINSVTQPTWYRLVRRASFAHPSLRHS